MIERAELVIIWADGEKQIEPFRDEEEARQAQECMMICFGKQVEWSCVRERRERD